MSVLTPDINYKNDALKNNTFDRKVLDKTLADIDAMSYKRMLEVQKNVAGFYKFDFKTTDLTRMVVFENKYVEYPAKWIIDIPEDFILDNMRHLYRTSQYFEKELDEDIITKNHKIFGRLFLLFRDGRLILSGPPQLLCREDVTHLIIPESIKSGTDWTIIFLPNEENAKLRLLSEVKSPSSNKYMHVTLGNDLPLTINHASTHANVMVNGMVDNRAYTHLIDISPNTLTEEETHRGYIRNWSDANHPKSLTVLKSITGKNTNPGEYRRNVLFFNGHGELIMRMKYTKESGYGSAIPLSHINLYTGKKQLNFIFYYTLPHNTIHNENVVKYYNTEDKGHIWIRGSLNIQNHLYSLSDFKDNIIVHPENILIFKRTDNGDGDYKYFLHTDYTIVKHYYPDIFKIKLSENIINPDDYIFFMFYKIRNDLSDFRINDFIQLRNKKLYPYNAEGVNARYYYLWYWDQTGTIFKYKNNLLPHDPLLKFYRDADKNRQYTDILNYKPYTIDYDHPDYWDNSNLFNDSFKYKSEKFKSLIKQNNWLLSVYNQNLNLETDSFYLDISNINLSKRLRTNTARELPKEPVKDLGGEHYVFKFHRDITVDVYQLRIFIDGILILPEHVYVTDENVIFYIPKADIKADSIMEIERLYEYVRIKKVSFAANTPIEFSVEDRYTRINNEDIFLVCEGRYVDRKDYKVEVLIDDIEWVAVSKNSFIPIDKKFRITIINNSFIGKDINVFVSRKTILFDRTVTLTGELKGIFRVLYDGVDDSKVFRTFKNGRLVPQYGSVINFNQKYKEKHSVFLSTVLKKGDRINIDILPYRYIEIFYKELLPENGLLELRDIIQRPFDLAWYDIYVNGRKLNFKQVEVLTPTLIQLKNINSRKHVAIYQRDRVIDYFRLTDPDIGYKYPEELIFKYTDLKDKLISGNIINDTEPDHVAKNENPIDTNIWEELYDDVLNNPKDFSFRFINPDRKQITKDVADFYQETLDEYKRLTINADKKIHATKMLNINPDKPEES